MGVMQNIRRSEISSNSPKTTHGRRSFQFINNNNSPNSSSHSPLSSPIHTFSSKSMNMEDNIKNAMTIITKWDINSSSFNKFLSLFDGANRGESREFIKSVMGLRRAMHFLVSENSSSDKLILAQNLMETAMLRLEKEFHQILSVSRHYLDPQSVSSQSSRMKSRLSISDDDDYNTTVGSEEEIIQKTGEAISEAERLSEIAMLDLKITADCMISSGYGTECLKIYKLNRKSVVDESLYRLGMQKYASSAINKMDTQALDRHIKSWRRSITIAVKTLFHGERFLCDHVFSSSKKIRESCFADISSEAAANIFRFPELVAKTKQRSPEKIFRLMDLYDSISQLSPDIDSIFSFESVSSVKLQALNSLLKIGDSVRTLLSEFESSIQKNTSKIAIPGGGIHPLTDSVMDYVTLLSNYSGVLSDIVDDSESLPKSPMLDAPAPAVSVRLAWIILVLLCKLDVKAELYNDVALTYLFLVNNLHFIVQKVRTTNLRYILGEEWILKNDKKVRQYATSYERVAWSKVFTSLPDNNSMEESLETIKGRFRKFNIAFEEAYQKQMSWVVLDEGIRDEIKLSIERKLVPAYRAFYECNIVMVRGERNHENLVKYSAHNMGNYLSDILHGSAMSEILPSFSSSTRTSFSSSTRTCKYTCIP
ncbi:exocyst complex component EXO70H1-like [Impatiens glandulifera]|uniref:exocyst complex component EXO70H1-like n=1 Tax=Impatiens glandulifera TaxID=253017 RepID=UPI001FB085E2|nr:exocyst complex component EXO70H1-like [Impatiens glandulifera]